MQEYSGRSTLNLLNLKRSIVRKIDLLLNSLTGSETIPSRLKTLIRLNTRVMPDFEASEEDFYIYLTITNALANRVNMEKLAEIKGKEHVFEGEIEGNFPEKDLPTNPILTLKKGAQVMLLNNDSLGRWINGSIGKVIDFVREDKKDIILVL